MTAENRRLLLKARPTGIPGPEHFSADSVPVRPPEPGEMLAETVYISIDPAMRSWAAQPGGEITYTAATPGSGLRLLARP